MIKKIQSTSNRKIDSITWKARGENVVGLLIKGSLSDIEKAKEAVEKIITAFEEEMDKTNTASNTESKTFCRFFLKGECNSGSYCGYSHGTPIKRKKTQVVTKVLKKHKIKK